MKVKHNKQIKKKRAKLKKIKTQLTTQKIEKHSIGKNKSMFAYKRTTVNIDNMDIDNAQNISSDSTVDSIRWDSSEGQIDKKIDNDWKLDNSEEETEEEEDWTQIAPKEKRNIDSPLVIEMLSDNVMSLNLPQIFKQEEKTSLDKETFYNDIFKIDAPSNEEACVIVAKSINFKDNTHMQTQTSSVPPNTGEKNENKDTSENKLDNISINNISSPKRNHMRKKLKSKKSTNCNTEKLHRSPRLQSNHIHQSRNKKAPEFYCIRNIVIVIMKSESRLCFTGKLLVKVLYGAVQIYGYILNKSTNTMEVYSPRGYSNIAIETSKVYSEDSNIDDIWMALAAEGITRDSESKLQADIDKVRPGETILVLQNFENNLTLFLKTYFSYFKLFPDVNNSCYYPWTNPKRVEIILQAELHLDQDNESNCKRLITDPCITIDIAQRMLSRWRANKWSCTLIAGGKNVGKSTSARYLINSLLRECPRVVLVDVDPGQAECTPPACISYSLIEEPLMGPNFTHLKTPVYQLFIDDVNVARCVTRYLEGVKMLIERLKEDPELSRLPIVVNTMGFAQNLGWDIAIFTIKLIRPSIIMQIMSSKKKNNYNNVFSAEVVNKQECTWTFCDERFIDWNRPCEHDLCVIYTQTEAQTFLSTVTQTLKGQVDQGPNQWNMEPYQQRELVMMSYLSDLVRDNNDSFHYNAGLSRSINQAVPYTAPFSSLCIIPQRLFGIPSSHALSVVNGNIVALCGIDLTEESSQGSANISTLRVLTQRSPLCTCYGFGIVRGVDMEQQQMFINTPLPISIMQHVNCLAGCIRVPPMLLQLHPGAPYVSGNATLPTSREPRKGYFRMRYKKKQSSSKS